MLSCHRRYAALERILFVWSKLNKGVRYVQGMNEIIGTIFFVLATDANSEWSCEAEAGACLVESILSYLYFIYFIAVCMYVFMYN